MCGMELAGEANLCAAHDLPVTDRWAAENRLMCNFLHRGITSTMTGVCGHPDSAHDYNGRCRVSSCSCDSFAPMPQVSREDGRYGARTSTGAAGTTVARRR